MPYGRQEPARTSRNDPPTVEILRAAFVMNCDVSHLHTVRHASGEHQPEISYLLSTGERETGVGATWGSYLSRNLLRAMHVALREPVSISFKKEAEAAHDC